MSTLLFGAVFLEYIIHHLILSLHIHAADIILIAAMCEQRLQINLELEECRRTFPDSIRKEGVSALPLTVIAKGMCYC